MTYLRQPIISVLGHVDHGKTSLLDFIRQSKLIHKEAGGITQHIGATEVPKKDLINVVKGFIPENSVKIPGLLFIDTPGHKAFTSLRKRGGSISDIGILIVDLNEGFKPQTKEAIEILKSMKTPFVVAANKLDNLPRWRSNPNIGLMKNIESQEQSTVYSLEEKVYEVVGALNEFGYEADRFDRIDDFTKKIAVVPISALTGEGIKELISTVVGLTQKYMEKKLTIENDSISKGVILEVKEYKGLGKTIDVILYDGVAKAGDIVLALDTNEIQRSKLKSILKPSEMKEIRDSSTKFATIKEIQSAAGIKFACPEFDSIKAGMPIITLRSNASDEEIEKYTAELESEKVDISLLTSQEGVLVKADTLGSLEALAHILDENDIPLRKAEVGRVTKKDIIDVNCDIEKNPKNALLLNFSQKIDPEILVMAKDYGVEIISDDIIYSLIDKAVEWIDKKELEVQREKLSNLELPFKIKIIPNCIFRASNPAIVGCEVLGGKVPIGRVLMTDYGKKIGKIKSIKDKDTFKQVLELNSQAAFSIDDLVVGRHAQESDMLFSFMGEENFRKLKKNVDLLSKDEIQTLKEIAEIMRKEDTLWGL